MKTCASGHLIGYLPNWDLNPSVPITHLVLSPLITLLVSHEELKSFKKIQDLAWSGEKSLALRGTRISVSNSGTLEKRSQVKPYM
jgi:hypothetical protein